MIVSEWINNTGRGNKMKDKNNMEELFCRKILKINWY